MAAILATGIGCRPAAVPAPAAAPAGLGAAREEGRQAAREDLARAEGYSAEVRDQRDAAGRKKAEAAARVADGALTAYAAVHDYALPAANPGLPGGGLAGVLAVEGLLSGPAAEDALRGFVYTFAGGRADDPATPADEGPGRDIELGHHPGPGGRAVLYGGGRVEWRPDAP